MGLQSITTTLLKETFISVDPLTCVYFSNSPRDLSAREPWKSSFLQSLYSCHRSLRSRSNLCRAFPATSPQTLPRLASHKKHRFKLGCLTRNSASGSPEGAKQLSSINKSNEEKDDSNQCDAATSIPRSKLQSSLWDWKNSLNAQVAYATLIGLTPLVPLLPRFEYSGQIYMLLTASLTIYIGSHRSLTGQMPSQITVKNSLVVPIACSAVLFGFYCLLRFFPDLDLKAFLTAYLALIGAIAVGSNLAEPFAAWGGGLAKWQKRIELPRWLVQNEGQQVHVDLRGTDIVAGLVGVLASVVNCQPDAPYTLNNFIAVCLVTELLQLLSLGSFATAAAMLIGLLAYDVFWVFESAKIFGDNVMVTVATSSAFSGPLKLTFPAWNASAQHPYQILGLGDITAPGLLVALMLRFDRSRNKTPQDVHENDLRELESSSNSGGLLKVTEDKTYFRTCMVAYAAGLFITIAVNKLTGAAQPALLYLVPSVLAGVGLAAYARAEGGLLLDYRDTALVPVEVEDEVTKQE